MGNEVGLHYTKTQFKKLVQLHGEAGDEDDESPVLNTMEATILRGALEFGQKPVSTVMTPWKKVFAIEVRF